MAHARFVAEDCETSETETRSISSDDFLKGIFNRSQGDWEAEVRLRTALPRIFPARFDKFLATETASSIL
jgi:hypothetical protein